MKYTIYKITNNINGKTYIGKHKTEDINDGYMGSGKLIKRAIKKYNVENFTKEILHIFNTEQEANNKEKELVVISENTYNLCPGGHGGFGYINNQNLRTPINVLNQKRLEKLSSNTEYLEYTKSFLKKANKQSHLNRPKETYIQFALKGTKAANNKGRIYMTCLSNNNIIACKSNDYNYYINIGYVKGRIR